MTTSYPGGSTAGSSVGSTQEIPVATQPHYEVSGNQAYSQQTYSQQAYEQPAATAPEAHADVENASVGQLIGEVTKDLSTLMRQELELAKAEMKVEAKKAGQGAGMFGAAGFSGYMVLLFLSIALWWALENVMDAGWAALIVAGVWAVIGAITFVLGRKKFREVNPKPERTVDTLQQVPSALKPH